jgi:hypothetical protein
MKPGVNEMKAWRQKALGYFLTKGTEFSKDAFGSCRIPIVRHIHE